MIKTKWEWDEFKYAGKCGACQVDGPRMSLCFILSGVLRNLWVCLDCRNDRSVRDAYAIYRMIGGKS